VPRLERTRTGTNAFESSIVQSALRDPVDRTAVAQFLDDSVHFAGSRQYPCIERRPILIDEESSLFSITDIASKLPTTQDRAYRDRASAKNYIRQRVLPGLTWDRQYSIRYRKLAERVAGQPVLVVGAGDRVEEYRRLFPTSLVVVSDVHLQFGADCAIDAHAIPFADRFFGLVLAAQVLEHTSRPWLVASEMQRVTQLGGVIHIEVPFGFPYHGAPYDFYRFTPSALRFLFAESELLELDITEGSFSSAAVFLSNSVVGLFGAKRLRQAALVGTRLGLWWMKYLDVTNSEADRFSSPKGLFITTRVDGVVRSDREMLREVTHLVSESPR
jgi:hypothetical protein